ncbi:MAG: hypothetical protein HYT79_12125 [Elusimicrobia bacterium]|nr:hypothetical protein [Elusimicrobiota bacterium]
MMSGKILIVEDDWSIADGLRRYLEKKLKDHARGLIRSEGENLDKLCGQLS